MYVQEVETERITYHVVVKSRIDDDAEFKQRREHQQEGVLKCKMSSLQYRALMPVFMSLFMPHLCSYSQAPLKSANLSSDAFDDVSDFPVLNTFRCTDLRRPFRIWQLKVGKEFSIEP